ncbi:MAG: alkaline phosphatase family protein [Rhodospirillales bacterium]|nr:alkaline phosphatase family protein [Rhodospirillales bacterium]
MGKVRNILFIMCDQLRADYLSCYGHPTLETPNLDRLASRGVLFSRAYTQAPVCGPSRMSFYTGRYSYAHGSSWNFVSLNVGIPTLGDYLRPEGLRSVLVGKTHMAPDVEGMKRLGVDPNSSLGILNAQCGFEPYERDDGLHPDKIVSPDLAYNKYLRDQGYDSDNPWHEYANSAEGDDGELLSGWNMRNAQRPARVKEEHSETPYMTDRAIEFMEDAGDDPWCLHLSYIKPHWPYIVPAPYHDMYSANQCLPVNKSPIELEDPHPVYAAYMNHVESQTFARDEVVQTVVPTYMGLVKQIDDNLGRLFEYLEKAGRMDDTLIVFTSDHGDFLGDHWLGEKELFYESSTRIPMIVYDPDPAADAARGSIDDRFVEAIDLVPTFIDAVGGSVPDHMLEGRSLLPLLRGESVANWRDAVFSEIDYAFYGARGELSLDPYDCRVFMVRTDRWKYIHHRRFRPQLFDMVNDPQEFIDLGDDPTMDAVMEEMKGRLFDWFTDMKTRTTISDEMVRKRTGLGRQKGIIIGEW